MTMCRIVDRAGSENFSVMLGQIVQQHAKIVLLELTTKEPRQTVLLCMTSCRTAHRVPQEPSTHRKARALRRRATNVSLDNSERSRDRARAKTVLEAFTAQILDK